ncbi:MAG: hypothetical protein Q4D29_02085 [Lachnospiraceae bacterium]|nr:hypothetical protein [Lachnospiraceae bacterium]
MVLKKMLKGIRRLVLTTGLLCGVGLFLCGNDVWADTSASIIKNGDNIDITLSEAATLDSVKLYYSDSDTSKYIEFAKAELEELIGADTTWRISKSKYIDKAKVKMDDLNQFTIYSADVSFTGGAGTSPTSTSGLSSVLPNVYKVTAKYAGGADGGYTTALDASSASNPKYQINGSADPFFGYAGDKYTITQSISNKNYWIQDIFNGSKTPWQGYLEKWFEYDEGEPLCKDVEISTDESKNSHKFVYLPKVNKIEIPKDYVLLNYSSTNNKVTIPLTKDNVIAMEASEANSKAIIKNMLTLTPVTPDNITFSTIENTESDIKATVNLTNPSYMGFTKIKVEDGIVTSDTDKNIYVYSQTPAIKYNEGNSAVVKVGSYYASQCDIVPGMNTNNPDINKIYVDIINNIKYDETSYNKDKIAVSFYDGLKGYVKVEGKKETEKEIVKLFVDASSLKPETQAALGGIDEAKKIVGSIEVKVGSSDFDIDKTVSAINNSGRNFITYNSDKKYKLDVRQLILDNIKDGNNSKVTSLSASDITDIKVADGSVSDGRYWTPSGKVMKSKVTCKIAGVDVSGIEVSAYPLLGDVKYNDNRTITGTVPKKISTAYDDENTVSETKGFKLILMKGSDEKVEFDRSDIKDLKLESDGDYNYKFTIDAKTVEALVDKAADKGEIFDKSKDSTEIKFKVIPSGKKANTDDTTYANKDVNGVTNTVNVYRVRVYGNHVSEKAYFGLKGQKKSITANVDSGYTVKGWKISVNGKTDNLSKTDYTYSDYSIEGATQIEIMTDTSTTNSTTANGQNSNSLNNRNNGLNDNSELYDDVPKTAESNSAIWLIIFMVFAVMGTTYALYLQLRAATSKNDK